MREAKKQLELLLINYLRSSYPDFPKGKIVSSESPDFIVKSKPAKKIGIELVRLAPEKLFNHLSDNDFRNELINEVRELFERSSNLKLFVKICFSEKKAINEERLLSVSAILANRIRSTVGNKNHRSFFFRSLNATELPDGIEQVLIVHHPEMEESVWEEANNLGISENVVADLKRAISLKEEKLLLYRKKKLDAYWLLVLTDQLRNVKSSNVVNRIFSESFKSQFGKVLLFDLMRTSVYEISL